MHAVTEMATWNGEMAKIRQNVPGWFRFDEFDWNS